MTNGVDKWIEILWESKENGHRDFHRGIFDFSHFSNDLSGYFNRYLFNMHLIKQSFTSYKKNLPKFK